MSPGIVRYTFNRTFLSNREREDSAFLRERSIDNACLVSITPLDSRLGSIRTRFVSAPYQFQACKTRSFSVPHSNNRVFFLRERSKDSREHGYPIEREREREHPATLLPGGNLRRNLGFNVRIHPREIFMGEEVHVPTISDSFRGASYHVTS